MKKMIFVLIVLGTLLVGCEPANIAATRWDSGQNGVNIKTRCERVDMRDNLEMEQVFAKYDGWKLIYVSEYTTGNKLGTDAAVCFEKVK